MCPKLQVDIVVYLSRRVLDDEKVQVNCEETITRGCIERVSKIQDVFLLERETHVPPSYCRREFIDPSLQVREEVMVVEDASRTSHASTVACNPGQERQAKYDLCRGPSRQLLPCISFEHAPPLRGNEVSVVQATALYALDIICNLQK